jgi:acyl-coenzyme A synthetase/AMP-(fatty) acid ligase
VISLERDAPALVARASDAEPAPEPALSEHDPHVMLYTSRTTGDPKGALPRCRTYVPRWPRVARCGGPPRRGRGRLCMFPMFHMGAGPCRSATGLRAAPWCSWRSRAGRDPPCRAARGRHQFYLIPTPNAVLARPEFEQTDLPPLRALGAAGAGHDRGPGAPPSSSLNPNLFVSTARPRRDRSRTSAPGRPKPPLGRAPAPTRVVGRRRP